MMMVKQSNAHAQVGRMRESRFHDQDKLYFMVLKKDFYIFPTL